MLPERNLMEEKIGSSLSVKRTDIGIATDFTLTFLGIPELPDPHALPNL